MVQQSFIARCDPHILAENSEMDAAKLNAIAGDMSHLRELGVVMTLVGNYTVGEFRYTNLKDALAQARLSQSSPADPVIERPTAT